MPARRVTSSANPNLIKGEIEQWRRPDWVPLLEAVGDLSRWFMWMGEIGLEDGTSVHSYKHRDTRRYLHLGKDGRWFEYVAMGTLSEPETGCYRPITGVEGIEEAFHLWDQHHLGHDDFAEHEAELNKARDHAKRGEPMPYDPAFLTRQRRFEAVCAAARQHEEENDPGFREVRFDEGNQFFGDMEGLDARGEAA